MPRPFALSERVVHDAVVLADADALRRLQLAGLRRNVVAEEFAEVAFADEADAGRVLLGVGGQAGLARERAHVGLRQVADREQRRGELFLAEGVEEIALVLVRVAAAQQAVAAISQVGARVVAGGDPVGTERARVFEERLELDLAVAQHVGIRRAPGAIFGEEVFEDAIPVLAGEVARVERDAELAADAHRIGAVAVGLAFAEAVVLLPVLHEQAGDVTVRRARAAGPRPTNRRRPTCRP